MRSAVVRRALVAAAVAVVAAGIMALSGCTMVGESLTGVSVERGGVASCVQSCQSAFKTGQKMEQKDHLANVEACMSAPDKSACLAAEGARHAAAMQALNAAKIECMSNCHRQGGGGAG